MELKRVSADEARKMSDDVEGTLKRIYKFITEQAKENAHSSFFNLVDPSEAAIKAIQSDLEKQGYKVTVENEEDDCVSLLIKW